MVISTWTWSLKWLLKKEKIRTTCIPSPHLWIAWEQVYILEHWHFHLGSFCAGCTSSWLWNGSAGNGLDQRYLWTPQAKRYQWCSMRDWKTFGGGRNWWKARGYRIRGLLLLARLSRRWGKLAFAVVYSFSFLWLWCWALRLKTIDWFKLVLYKL